jgi:hypothetical protein
MRGRLVGVVAWAVAGVSIALHVVAIALYVAARDVDTPGDHLPILASVGFLACFVLFPVAGAFVVSRRPRHPVGWLLLYIGVALALNDFLFSYADYAIYARPGSLPAGIWLGWLGACLDPLWLMAVALLLLLFPDGRPPSPRWRPVLWLVLGTAVLGSVHVALKPGTLNTEMLPAANPAGIESLSGLFDVVNGVLIVPFAVALILSAASVIVRFRRSRGEERLQMKWLAFAAGLLIAAFLVGILVLVSFGYEDAGGGLVGAALAVVPVAIGIAILRYRLYEIDRVISRTLVYGLLTVVLGGAYAGLVLAGQWAFSSFAGGSDLAIAVSTLVVAALFLPLRRRIQGVVDRRFYRRRYDAQRTLDAFGSRLREQVELGALAADLRGVVDETMQPAHVSLWLRGEPAS